MAQKPNKNEENPPWTNLLQNVLWTVATIYDIVSFIPYKMLTMKDQYRRSQSFAKSVCKDGDVTKEWSSNFYPEQGLLESMYGNKVTLPEAFDRVCQMYPERNALGTRELLSEVDEKQPNGKIFKKAVYGKYHWMTYSQLHKEVMNLAAGLSELGIKRCCFFMETRAEWMVAAQACFHHNIQVVTVYSTLGENAVAQALKEAEIDVVITSASLCETKLKGIIDQVPEIKTVIYAPFENRQRKLDIGKINSPHVDLKTFEEVKDLGKHSNITSNPNAQITKNTIAVIMYTSGTTGKPKGVLISHGNIIAGASGYGQRLMAFDEPLKEDDLYLGYLPLAHILELAAESCTLYFGVGIGYSSTLTLSDKSSRIKKGSKGDASELKPTIMAAVPEISERIRKAVMSGVQQKNAFARTLFNFAYEYKLKQVEKSLPTPILDKFLFKNTAKLMGGRIRIFISGGAPLDVKTQRFINVCMCTGVVGGYGLTETSASTTLQDLFDNRSGTVGPLLESAMIKLEAWPEGNYSPYDKPHPRGEIIIGGNTVGHGYYKMPEKTKEDFSTDENGIRWFRTGDIGMIDENGQLVIVDRKKDLVKLRHGEYIALGNIEAVLKTSRLCDNLCIFADQNELSCVAVAVVNHAQIQDIASSNNIEGDLKEIVKNKIVVDAVYKDLVKCANVGKLGKAQTPSAVHLETEPWLPETGLVTDALKIKRKVINEHYADIITNLYKK